MRLDCICLYHFVEVPGKLAQGCGQHLFFIAQGEAGVAVVALLINKQLDEFIGRI